MTIHLFLQTFFLKENFYLYLFLNFNRLRNSNRDNRNKLWEEISSWRLRIWGEKLTAQNESSVGLV